MVEVSLRLEKGEGVRVFGPARVRVARGLVSVLGAELGEGEEVNIDRYRSYYVKSLGSSEIEASIGGEGRIEAPSRGEEPYDEWLSIADMVISSCPSRCRVAVVGPPESGKTSFTALLANRSLVRGLPTGVVDSDIGQADVGPPGFVSLAMPDSWVTWLRGLDPVDMRFVGSIEPSHVA
ncbi:MAG: hypothetical protein LRS43_00455, partial [Desulfurococcales archaeon]|nr:hypothetical protein [Desulfurococcales archaeon]